MNSLPLIVLEMNGLFSINNSKLYKNCSHLANILCRTKQKGVHKYPILILNDNQDQSDRLYQECFLRQSLQSQLDNYQPTNDDCQLQDENFVLMHGHLRKSMQKHKDEMVLLLGNTNLKQIAQNEGLLNYITQEEMVDIFPELVPIGNWNHVNYRQQIKAYVDKRDNNNKILEMFKKEKKNEYQIGAVMVLDIPQRWEHSCQLICDVLSTKDGNIGEQFNGGLQHVPVYFAYCDSLYRQQPGKSSDQLGLLLFQQALNEAYKLVYDRDIDLKYDSQREFIKYLKQKGEMLGGDIDRIYWLTKGDSNHEKYGVNTIKVDGGQEIEQVVSQIWQV